MLYGSVDNSDTVCSEQSIVVTSHFTFLRNIEKAHSKFHCFKCLNNQEEGNCTHG